MKQQPGKPANLEPLERFVYRTPHPGSNIRTGPGKGWQLGDHPPVAHSDFAQPFLAFAIRNRRVHGINPGPPRPVQDRRSLRDSNLARLVGHSVAETELNSADCKAAMLAHQI